MINKTPYIEEVAKYAKDNSIEAAMNFYSISRESVRRYIRCAINDQEDGQEDFPIDNSVFRKLQERFSVKELEAIANGRLINPEQENMPVLSFDGEEVCFGVCTDTHLGSKYSPRHYWESFLEECEKQNVQGILHAGDLIDGMSNRPDHIYGLSHIGYSAQIDYAVELLSLTSIPIHIIAGNHCLWGIKSGGLDPIKEIASHLPHVDYLGHHQGVIEVNDTKWLLWHGEDGASYAASYRIQKITESFTGGEKPAVLITGHDHKSLYIFNRNIHCVGGGALTRQSLWMRNKKLKNDDGFWIIRATIADKEIKRFSPTWYALY